MRGLGVSVLSTPQGILVDREAARRKVGGELLCARCGESKRDGSSRSSGERCRALDDFRSSSRSGVTHRCSKPESVEVKGPEGNAGSVAAVPLVDRKVRKERRELAGRACRRGRASARCMA